MATIHVEGLSTATPEVYLTNLSRGDYNVVVQSADPIVSSKGSEGIKFDLLVEDGPMQVISTRNGPVEMSPVGRHIFPTLYLPHSGQKDGGKFCASRLAKVLEVLGLEASDDIDLDEFIGKRCKVRNVPRIGDDGDERDDITRWMEA